jgi:hypothetical protein
MPDSSYSERRCARGGSDSISLECKCKDGSIVLFYNFLPIEQPVTVAAKLEAFASERGITGYISLI